MTDRTSCRRALDGLNLAVFLAAVATIAVVVNVLAFEPALRFRFDATKTRAYSLSDQTRRLLADLDGPWTIALVLDRGAMDPAVLRQVDEVLDRYREASPNLDVVRIDPAEPETLDQYEALLSRLQTIHRDRIAAFDDALQEASETADLFAVFLQQQSGRLVSLRQALAADEPALGEIDQLLSILALRVQQAEQVQAERRRALRVDENRALPDYETARSILVAGLSGWAEEQFRLGQMMAAWLANETLGEAVRAFASDQRPEHERWAQELAAAADPLRHLPPLELGRIGRALEQGEAAIVLGPPGAAVVPSAQLLPRLQRDAPGVTFDQRFRGDQIISAAIRSVLVEQMPLVVFAHAQEESMLLRRGQNIDLVGAAAVLEASRFDIAEWIVGQSDRPAAKPEQPVVWIIVPPVTRTGLEPSASEQALVEATRQLLEDGAAVMLNVHPSLLAKFGRADPWGTLAGRFGLVADTARVVFEQVQVSPQETSQERGQIVQDFPDDHAIARAVHGQRTYLVLPVPILQDAQAPAGVRRQVVARIEPSADRWLEDDWSRPPQPFDRAGPRDVLEGPVPVVVIAEGQSEVTGGQQRFMLVGSGGWMLSYITDIATSVGGERVALEFPGNYELLLASVAWLAEMDELIAPSAVSQQVERLDGVTARVKWVWGSIVVGGVPVACLVLGVLVWGIRRR
ncbi:MAG: DUF7088 domain-containing protein [Planctomycetota bacterium]|jgi:hypothetical protein